MPECFPDPEVFDPGRYTGDRAEDKQLFAWIPFGAGRHRCVGAAFAMMQLKAIFSALLRNFEFELSQPGDTYRNDESKMVIQLQQPCKARYRRRKQPANVGARKKGAVVQDVSKPQANFRIEIDRDLCQSHAVCVSEAPEVFSLDEDKQVVIASDIADADSHAIDMAVKFCPTGALTLKPVNN
jgi:sterol 14-demethylase